MEDKKFIETFDVNDWEVLTDDGWEDIVKIHKTIPYRIWILKTESFELKCADNHIVFTDDMNEIFVKDLKIGDKILTENGIEEVTFILETDEEDNMYDLELNEDSNHRYYTNGILSHNTQTSVCYILWFAMAHSHKTILITSFGDDSAKKNLADVKFVYEYCPDFLKAGIVRMNESTIVFDNGSKIISKPTTGKSVRGNSPSLIYCDEFAFVGTVGNKSGSNLQEEFYAAVSPALAASKGKICITSTPISETDLFHHLWVGAINKQDDNGLDMPKDYMIEMNGETYRDLHLFKSENEGKLYLESIGNPDGWKIVSKEPCGNNGFMSQLATWEKCPGRTEEWARLERKKVGDERFSREFNCLSGDTMVSIIDDKGIEITSPIETLYSYHMFENNNVIF